MNQIVTLKPPTLCSAAFYPPSQLPCPASYPRYPRDGRTLAWSGPRVHFPGAGMMVFQAFSNQPIHRRSTAGRRRLRPTAWQSARQSARVCFNCVFVGKRKEEARRPLLPSSLAQWVEPGAWGAVTTFLAVNRLETRASETRLNQRIEDLKEETRAGEAGQAQRTDEFRADTNKPIDELRADNRALGEKMDRLPDARLAGRQT